MTQVCIYDKCNSRKKLYLNEDRVFGKYIVNDLKHPMLELRTQQL